MLHCHDCLELDLVEQGSGKYIIGGRLYPICKGDIFVINNLERHLAIHDDGEFTMTVVVFDSDYVWKKYGQDYLKPFYQRGQNFSNRIHRENEGYAAMRKAFSNMLQETVSRRAGWEMVTEANANLLLALIYRHYQEKRELQDYPSQSFDRISRALEYIDTHFVESITLDQLARETSLSRTHLCKCFKDITGQTLFTYIEQVRVQHACYLLSTSGKSLTETAMESGFENISYFNRVFKKVCGCTPGQYRRGSGQASQDETTIK